MISYDEEKLMILAEEADIQPSVKNILANNKLTAKEKSEYLDRRIRTSMSKLEAMKDVAYNIGRKP